MKRIFVILAVVALCIAQTASDGEDFEVNADSGIQAALEKICGGGSVQAKSTLGAAAAAKPSQADFSAASAAAPAGAAKPSMAALSAQDSAKGAMIVGRPIPINPYYRRRLHCRVTYWPTWKICCWFTWWWWYM